MAVIEVENLSFSYTKNAEVLKNISFKAEEGSYVCLLGPNGAGKSTLFQCMLGLNEKYKGCIRVCGEDIKSLSEKQLARKIAYIPQSSVHAFNYTVDDVVLMGTTSLTNGFASPGQKERKLAMDALKRLNIEYLSGRKYKNISGGERQLVLIARALAQQAKILFMDEPTANLDYGNQCRVLEEINRLSSQGYTIIQSTHNPDHALMYADCTIAISGGTVAAFGNPREVLNSELMSRLYGVNVRLVNVDGLRICLPAGILNN